jgi:glycosyltransferase involved in cell wall biosynthesis
LSFTGRTLYSLRRKGARVYWIVHNVDPHETISTTQHLMIHFFKRMVDVLLPLTPAAGEEACRSNSRLARKPRYVVPHGHFRTYYPNTSSRASARETLGIPNSSRVVLFFGNLKEYKGVTDLMRAFSDLRDPGTSLLIVGQARLETLARSIREKSVDDPRIRVFLDNVPDEDVHLYFNACDLVALPFRKVTHSGSMILALSFNRPVLVPDIPTLTEMVEADVRRGPWLQTYEGALSSEILEGALSESRRIKDQSVPLDQLAWARISETLSSILGDR